MSNTLIFIILLISLLIPNWLYAKEVVPSLALAKHFKNDMQSPSYWVSEKLDGIRCYWDGISLVTRNGNKINPPLWFTQSFPTTEMDGELWIGRGSFQLLTKIALDDKPNVKLWEDVSYQVFDLPSSKYPFELRQKQLKAIVDKANIPHLKHVRQEKITGLDRIQLHLKKLVNQGAEGIMLRTPGSPYVAGRSKHLLKMKLRQDAEARVIAYQTGRGKYENMMGAIWVEMEDGTLFKIGTGFSDEDRKEPPIIGADITFSYQGLTDRGLPRFASFEREKVKE
ncbi:MAG: DNA ligase-1 [Crocinitomicaceae bacterium]|jgi:DNA ligase-1